MSYLCLSQLLIISHSAIDDVLERVGVLIALRSAPEVTFGKTT